VSELRGYKNYAKIRNVKIGKIMKKLLILLVLLCGCTESEQTPAQRMSKKPLLYQRVIRLLHRETAQARYDKEFQDKMNEL